MKKIHLLILKAFIRPFFVTFFIVMFVLLMLFLFKYIDDLIGKGFEWYIILELMMYASATNVAMALPLAILLSSIMTFGSLGENYELVAIKSAGVSLSRAMYPMVIVVALLSITAFMFSDYMLPVANLKYYSLLYDARQQKSTNLLPEGIFSSNFPGYSIRVRKKDPDGQRLYDMMIYEKNQSTGNNSVVFAKEGSMYRTPDDSFLVLKLKNGIRYEETNGDKGFNPRQRLTRLRFKETEQKFDLSNLKFKRTSESEFKSAYQMMNIKQLAQTRKIAEHGLDSALRTEFQVFRPYVKYFAVPYQRKLHQIGYNIDKGVLSSFKPTERLGAVNVALGEARALKDLLDSKVEREKDTSRGIRSMIVEYQRKFTLSAACLVLFLIGAPLGAIIRKGGLGLPVVVSVAFFLIYHIISTIGEKSAKDGHIPPAIGMWIAIVVLTPLGIFLTYKAATDSAIFDVDIYKKVFLKLIEKKSKIFGSSDAASA
ncbi:LptF/LptG family permease [Mucilaginibacter arboris]|uniref:LptF/LptG family permease n=1 Tax=Mucilaginibacter arboris TaxID=2682090 RepID=A0A7K1SZB7_9SPHI|nr:LptF/LptG family permease [Mucilaginibacter arboris]MVN22598.1 LptF/LptG family permease [Mucilaginibacter arboris]